MHNRNTGNGYGDDYPVQPHAVVDMPPEEQYPDREDTYTGGLASQDVNAQHYVPNSQDQQDGGLTYSEGRTYQHSDSFADHAPHTLVCNRLTALPVVHCAYTHHHATCIPLNSTNCPFFS